MFCIFFLGNIDKMLPKPRFSKLIFGHSAGSQLNWTGPIANNSLRRALPRWWCDSPGLVITPLYCTSPYFRTPPPPLPCSSAPWDWSRLWGRGCDEEGKIEDHWERARHSVNEGFGSAGKTIYWRGWGHSSEPPNSENPDLQRPSSPPNSAPNPACCISRKDSFVN